jgi:hypothetical protein
MMIFGVASAVTQNGSEYLPNTENPRPIEWRGSFVMDVLPMPIPDGDIYGEKENPEYL